jgi:hypothetical protein
MRPDLVLVDHLHHLVDLRLVTDQTALDVVKEKALKVICALTARKALDDASTRDEDHALCLPPSR